MMIANVGDSRICMLGQKGLKRMTKDHKPEEENEKRRIIRNGGKLYKEELTAKGSIKYFQSDVTNRL